MGEIKTYQSIVENRQRYRECLAKIVFLAAIRTPVSKPEVELLIDLIIEHYPPRKHPEFKGKYQFTPEYIEKIWQHGIAGKFEMPEHFQLLSWDYIGDVMYRFTLWLRKQKMQPPVAKPEVELVALPPADNDAINKSICLKEFERFKEKGAVFLGATCYDALVELDQFEPTLWEDYVSRANALETVERGDKGKASGSIIQYRTLLASITPQTITTRAKTLAVEEYFKTIETAEELGL